MVGVSDNCIGNRTFWRSAPVQLAGICTHVHAYTTSQAWNKWAGVHGWWQRAMGQMGGAIRGGGKEERQTALKFACRGTTLTSCKTIELDSFLLFPQTQASTSPRYTLQGVPIGHVHNCDVHVGNNRDLHVNMAARVCSKHFTTLCLTEFSNVPLMRRPFATLSS